MPHQLTSLKVKEVSAVDRPANSETDPDTGKKVARARIALFKRDTSVEKYSYNQGRDKGKFAAGGGVGAGQHAAENASTPDAHKAAAEHHGTQAARPELNPSASKAHELAASAHKKAGDEPSAANSRAARSLSLAAGHLSKRDQYEPDDDVQTTAKGEVDNMMTLAEMEEKVLKMEPELAAVKADNVALKTANEVLKAENDAVLKMSEKQRKAFAAMSDKQKAEYMAADTEKRKSMMEACDKAEFEKALVDGMDAVGKADFEKAGPEKQKLILADLAKKAEDIAKKGKKKGEEGDDEPDADDEETMKVDKKLDDRLQELNRIHILKMAEAEDRIAKTEAEIAAIRKRERLIHFTKMAEDKLPNLPGMPEEKGARLMKTADAFGGEGTEDFKQYMDERVNANKALSIHYGEVGKAGAGPLNAEKMLEAKVEEVAKRDKISKVKAWDVATNENPELVFEYEREQRHALSQR